MLSWQEAFKNYSVGFGGAALSGEGGGYGFGSISENDAVDLVQQAYELGFKVFDTAPIYGFGVSEQRLGKAIKSFRDNVFVVSKCGIDWDEKKNVAINNDAKTTSRMLENSLRQMQLDTIDLYMVHWPDQNVDIRRTVEVIQKAKEQGKVRYIGLCNTNEDELRLASEVAKIDVIQNQYHVFDQSSVKLFSSLAANDQGFMSWGTLDKGIITGRVSKNRSYDKDDVRGSDAPWFSSEVNDPKITAMEKLLPWLEERGHSGLELALSHNLNGYKQADLTGIALCGAKNIKQLQGLSRALENLLSQELLQEAKNII